MTRVRKREWGIGFARRLGVLLKAGVPMKQGLTIIYKQQQSDRFRGVMRGIMEDIHGGQSLSYALGKHGDIFDEYFVKMVESAEVGDNLAEALMRIVSFRSRQAEAQKKMVTTSIYPVTVMGIAVVILMSLMVFIVPRFHGIYEEMLSGKEMPWLTRGFIGVSSAIQNHLGIVLLMMVLCVILGVFLLRREGVRGWFSGIVARMPVIREMVVKFNALTLGQTLSSLLKNGVPILQAMSIATTVVPSVRMKRAIRGMIPLIHNGLPLSKALQTAREIPPELAYVVEIGEETGQIPQMLGDLVDIYEGELDEQIARVSALIEPLMIIFLAAVIGALVIALFLPIVQIMDAFTVY